MCWLLFQLKANVGVKGSGKRGKKESSSGSESSFKKKANTKKPDSKGSAKKDGSDVSDKKKPDPKKSEVKTDTKLDAKKTWF